MEQKELLTVIVADDETELREAVCSVIPWKEIGFRLVGSAGTVLMPCSSSSSCSRICCCRTSACPTSAA